MTDTVDAQASLRRNLGMTVLTLIASSGTLVCCVLPAVMVALGAGAALACLVAVVPQLVWLSEHKVAVFGLATALLALSGLVLWRARTLPCPAEPALASACNRLRRMSMVLWCVGAVCTVLSATFAFVLPGLR